MQTVENVNQWIKLALEDKLLQFASFLSHMSKDLRLGGLTGIYLLIKNNDVGDEIKRVIVEEIYATLAEYTEQEELFIICSLETIGLIGPNERSLSRMGIIRNLLLDPALKRLQDNCFCTMM